MGTISRLNDQHRPALAAAFHGGATSLDEDSVKQAYRRWAPIYDWTFGLVSAVGRRSAVQLINTTEGRVLEVGVGTGLSLPHYQRHLEVIGIDLAPEMLARARERVAGESLDHVTGLHEMDASTLTFPDASFDTVVAMYVMTVVPDPVAVMRELSRVVKPGGEVMLVNHFSQDEGVRGVIERKMAPFGDRLGWHPLFDISRVMVCDDLELIERTLLNPMGIFTMLRFKKVVAANLVPLAQAS
jgi:phosphatidylethanolamine/phosphatidyl-N-methylethanolamine N-methyltransferase